MNKGYVKFDSLYQHFHFNNICFYNKSKRNMLYEVIDNREVGQFTRLFKIIKMYLIKLTSLLMFWKVMVLVQFTSQENFSGQQCYNLMKKIEYSEYMKRNELDR